MSAAVGAVASAVTSSVFVASAERNAVDLLLATPFVRDIDGGAKANAAAEEQSKYKAVIFIVLYVVRQDMRRRCSNSE